MLGLALAAGLAAAAENSKTGPGARLGITSASYTNRSSFPPLEFLEHCHELGGGGIQLGIGAWEKGVASRLREKAEEYQMYLEGQVRLPDGEADLARFKAQLETAREAGARIVRSVTMNGRRYETFDNLEAFQEFAKKAKRSLELAEKVVRTVGVKLALENHKDWRAGELIAHLQRLSSEWVGVCVDIGNNIALLEDPMAVVESLRPWGLTSHFKDMGIQEYEDGFLLSEVPLGQGFLNLGQIIRSLRESNPAMTFNLEMITRDPLKVLCLARKYWVTFGDIPAKDLAATVALLKTRSSKTPLPAVSGLNREERIRFEEENVRKCFAFARKNLGL